MKKEIEELKEMVNGLLIANAQLSAECKTLQEAFLGVAKESLPDEQYQNLRSNYLQALTENTQNAIRGLHQHGVDKGRLLAEEFSVLSAMRRSFSAPDNGDR